MRKNRFKKEPRISGAVWRGLILGRLILGLRLTGLLILLIAVSAVFVAGYAAITRSAYFGAQTISIEGNHHISRQEIFQQADLKPGDNLLDLNLRVIRKRLMSHPWIRSAQVTRQIPRTLTIRVEEQQPLAVLDLGSRYLINCEGHIFKEIDQDDPAHLPVITGISYADLSLAQAPLSEAMLTIMQVLALSRGDQAAVPYSAIAGLHLDKDTGVTLSVGDSGRLIKLGFGQFEKKNRLIKQVFDYLEEKPQWRNFYALDANNPERIVVQPGSIPQANANDA